MCTTTSASFTRAKLTCIYFMQARRKRCGMAAVAAPKICREREREKKEKGEKKEKRGERETRGEKGKKGREEQEMY